MNSKSGKKRPRNKVPVIEGLPKVPKRPNTSTGWDFDFSTSPPRAKNSQVDLFQDADECQPSQSIESDVDVDDPISPILSLSEPALKRLKYLTQEEFGSQDQLLTSAVRTLNFDKLVQSKKKDSLSDSDVEESLDTNEIPKAPSFLFSSQNDKKFPTPRSRKIKRRLSSATAARSEIEDSDSQTEDIIANSQTDKRSVKLRQHGDPLRLQQLSGQHSNSQSVCAIKTISRSWLTPTVINRHEIVEDDPVIIVDSSDSENEIESSNTTYRKGEERLTGIDWLKKVDPKRLEATLSQDSGKISATSSPSQQPFLDNRAPDKDDESFWSSKKKKKRPAFGLVSKLDIVLKKQLSDRVLRQHIAARKTAATDLIGRQCRKGRIEKVAKINRMLCFVECRNLKLPQKHQSPCFRVIVNLRMDPDKTLIDNLVPGNDVVIEGPWNITKNSGQSEEVLLNYDNLFVVKNVSCGYDPDCQDIDPEPKILLDKDCECSGEYSRKSCLSRSKKFKQQK